LTTIPLRSIAAGELYRYVYERKSQDANEKVFIPNNQQYNKNEHRHTLAAIIRKNEVTI